MRDNHKIDITELPKHIIQKFVDDPVFYITTVFNVWLWSKQREILLALRKYKKVAVYSCTGAGKSFLGGATTIWFLQTHPNSIIPIVGASFDQVHRSIWRNVIEFYHKARIKLLGEPTSTRWEITKGQWWASVLSARKIEAIQGIHAPYQLQIIDEASSVEDYVWDALDGNMSGGCNYRLVLGNPLRPEGHFYKTLFDPSYYKVKISVFDTPLFTGEINEIPKKYRDFLYKVLPNEDFVENARRKYGEDSTYWKVKILGEFPLSVETGMFSPSEIELAMNNPNPDDKGEYYITVDIARYGEDSTVIAIWKGFKQEKLIELENKNLMEIVGFIIKLYNDYKGAKIIVDSTGLGAGVVDRLDEQGYKVYPINFSERAFEDDKYANIITEAFFMLKESINAGLVKLVDNDMLKNELLAMEYTFDSKGRFKLIDSKYLKKHKLGRSPDRAMATALRFVIPQKVDVYFL